MVGIFTGAGYGFGRGSGSVLGDVGLLGGASLGRGGEGVFVNAASGNLLLSHQDEYLVGLGPDAGVSRSYNSLTSLGDDNNDGWRQSTDRRVYGLSGTLGAVGSTVKRVAGDGTEITYDWDASASAYVAKDGGGAYDRIAWSAGEWVWTDGDSQTVERYFDDASGRIKSVADANGNTLSFAYDAQDRLSTVTTSDGAWIRYDWIGSTNNIGQIVTGYTDLATSTAQTLTRTRYGYDAQNRLTSVTVDLTPGDGSVADGASYVTSYSYDAAGRVASITQSDGSALAITYDASGRVETLVQTVSSGVTRTTSLAYGTGYTTITDPAGQVTRLDYDAAGNLTKITAPPAYSGAAQQVVQFAYNANGDLISTSDGLGQVTSYSNFTANGLAQTVTDRLGNSLTRSFDSTNQLLSETRSGIDASGASTALTDRLVYDAKGNLRFRISAEGRVSEYVLNAAGQVVSEITYAEVAYTTSGAVDETAMAAWVAGLVDRSWVQRSDYVYDARGAVQSVTRYGLASSSGAGLTSDGSDVTHFTYDQTGALLASYSGTNAASSYVYDGLGRLISSSDANGGTTSFTFNDAATTTTITLASGYVTTQTWNKAGELVSQTDSGSYTSGGTTSYAYDALGRVRVRTDAAGLKTYTIYDGAGRHVGDVDAGGYLTEYRYDANNRLVGTIVWHTAISAANLTALANPANTLTLATLRPAAHAEDSASWVVYDAEGRVLQTIAGNGATSISSYDAAGRLLQTVHYTTKLAASTVAGFVSAAPTAVIAPSASAGDVVARNFYDRDGLLLGALDGEGYLVQNSYDAAGQLVASTAFATPTSSGLRASGSFNALLASVGTSAQDRTSHFVYDGRGMLRYTIDALGEVSAFAYDSAGQQIRTAVYGSALTGVADYSYDNIKALVAPLEASSAKRVSQAVYDSAGRLAYAIAADGEVTGYSYDTMGRVTRTVRYATLWTGTGPADSAAMASWSASNLGNSANQITRSWYTARGEAAWTVDGEGFATRYDYDAKGQVTGATSFNSAISTSDTTTIAQIVTATTGLASVTRTWSYDSLGRVTQEVDGMGVATSYAYHGASQLRTQMVRAQGGTAQEQSVTHIVYDGAGQVLQTIVGEGTSEAVTTSALTNGLGEVTSALDGRGNTTSYTYDLAGRVKAITNAAGGVTSFEYNAFGNVVKQTDPNGNATYSWYDALGRVSAVRDAGNYLTTTSYSAYGEIATVSRWVSPVTGTPVMNTAPVGSGLAAVTSFTYDALGRVVSSTDALGGIESYSYDALGNRASLTGKLGAVTSYSYDRRGLLVSESVVAASYRYDASGTQASSGSTLTTKYEYDARGNRTKQIEAWGLTEARTTLYSYDANGRLTQVAHDAVSVMADDMVTTSTVTPTEQYSYDARGNVIKTVDAGGAQSFAWYDDLDRKIAEVRQLSATQAVYTSYSYDANGNLVSSRVYDGNATLPSVAGGVAPPAPSGLWRQTDFTYDGLNRTLTSTVVSTAGNAITSGSWNGTSYVTASGSLVTQYQYDADGNVVKLTDANGAVSWNWYDALGRKTAQLDATGYLTSWSYDAEGNVLGETRFATKFTGTPTLAAPPTVTTTAADRTTLFTYDANGNRLSEKRTGVAAWSVDASTGALSAAGSDALISYSYNALGQVLTKTVAGTQIASWSYDNTGRLTSESKAAFTDANGVSVTPTTSYQYDALGNLSRTSLAGTSGTYASADRVTSYSYGAGGRLATMRDAEGFVHNYAYDAMGRLKKDSYARLTNANTNATTSTTTTVNEARGTTYDLAGRVLSQSVYSTIASSFQRVDYASFQYNNFDQVTQQGSGGNASGAMYQVTNQYDGAGRLTGTNAGDGVWKFFGYDKAGNQTAALTSAGASFTSTTGFAGALGQVANANVNGTWTVYDARGMATQVVEEGRQLSSTVSQTLVTSRAYNAFGEVASETNALGYTISYSYNTMGRMLRSESPAVQITNENGSTNWVRPSEDYYYDLGGRLVATRDANGSYAAGGTQAAPVSKAANTGNLTTLALLAGTGYDGSQAMASIEFHSDGGKKQTLYDIMGDARVLRDELYSASAPLMHVTEQSFNKLGQLTQVKHNRTIDGAGDANRLIDSYAYDQFGQRIQHWNSQFGSGFVEKAGYDALGRITSQTDYEGYVTATAYVWDGTLTTSGLGGNPLGGWVETTTYANARTLIVKSDLYGRELFKQDLGAHTFTSAYDAAGRVVTKGTESWTWYNTSLLASDVITTGTVGSATLAWDRYTYSYSYDALGNRLTEKTVNDGRTTIISTYNDQLTNATSTYDALGRLTSVAEAGSAVMPSANVAYKYDANSNIRRSVSTHYLLSKSGDNIISTQTDYWFRYDAMNRLVTDKGALSGTAGAAGTTIIRPVTVASDITYDLSGQRVSSAYTYYEAGYYDDRYYYHWVPDFYQEVREIYEYDGAGRITAIRETKGVAGTDIPPAPTTGGTQRSAFTYDQLGRQLSQTDYLGDGVTVAYSRTAVHNKISQLTSDSVSSRKWDGKTYKANSTYTYADGGTGQYLLGAVGQVTAVNYINSIQDKTNSTANSYQWWDGAMQGTISYKADISSSTTWTTTFTYDPMGRLTKTSINDGRPRTVTFKLNGDSQIIRRDEKDNSSEGDPHEIWYRFAGREWGFIGNNGTNRLTETASIDDRQLGSGTGAFRNGSTQSTSYVDFSQSYDPINSYYQGSAGGSYTVAAGDTLSSIAERLWGDSSLWYKLAEANGITGNSGLVDGQNLVLPVGTIRSANNAKTLKPYNASEAIGNVSPTAAKPPKKKGCGVFGMVLLAVVAIAVAVVTAGAAVAATAPGIGGIFSGVTALAAGTTGLTAGALVGIGAASAALGSIVSQGLGVATGIQDKFSWKGVAFAAIGGAVGGALGPGGVLENGLFGAGGAIADVGSGILNAGLNGMAANVMIQGVGVATGLQSKFSWTGVAAAGVGAMAGYAAGKALGIKPISHSNRSFGAHMANMVPSGASMIANAATRSLINGSDFGDNIVAALPDVIAQTVGGMLRQGVVGDGPALDILGSPDAAAIDAAIVNGNAKLTELGGVLGIPSLTGSGNGARTALLLGVDPETVGRSALSVNVEDNGRQVGAEYLHPQESRPTSIDDLNRQEMALEAANNKYRSAHNDQDYADYQKYKDNIAGWRQILGQDQDEIIVTARPRTDQASVNGQVGQITAALVGKQVEAFADAAIETGASARDVKYIRRLGTAMPLVGSAITFKQLRQQGFSVQAALAGTAANEITGDRIIWGGATIGTAIEPGLGTVIVGGGAWVADQLFGWSDVAGVRAAQEYELRVSGQKIGQ